MSQYETLVAEIKTRIRSAWGATFLISCGRPKVPFSAPPYAVISLVNGAANGHVGRQVVRTWDFEILGVFAFDGIQDSEGLAMAKAELLMQELEPFDDTTPPTPESPFAGICDQHFVTSFSPLPEEIEDSFVICKIGFRCETHVYA